MSKYEKPVVSDHQDGRNFFESRVITAQTQPLIIDTGSTEMSKQDSCLENFCQPSLTHAGINMLPPVRKRFWEA